jgi:hypothetical protein
MRHCELRSLLSLLVLLCVFRGRCRALADFPARVFWFCGGRLVSEIKLSEKTPNYAKTAFSMLPCIQPTLSSMKDRNVAVLFGIEVSIVCRVASCARSLVMFHHAAPSLCSPTHTLSLHRPSCLPAVEHIDARPMCVCSRPHLISSNAACKYTWWRMELRRRATLSV